MYSNKDVKSKFDSIFNEISKHYEVTEADENGTGYFNNLAIKTFDDLEPKKFIDEHGRRGIIIPIKSCDPYMFPNIVFFERYIDGDLIVKQDERGHDNERNYNLLRHIYKYL